jgi:hypothetical protein
MGTVNKRNGGYIGANYRKPFPSGVHVVGGVGRIVELEIDVELYGGKGGGAPYTSTEGGNGGYTKFRVKLDSTKLLQVRPTYQAGGANTAQSGGGGAGSGLLVSNIWVGVAGGGGGAGQRFTYDVANNNTQRYPNSGATGSGGYGSGTPSLGADGQSCGVYSDTMPPNYTGGSGSGGGGGGAAGGGNGGSGCYGSWFNPGPTGGGAGGAGNLRIYKDQSVTSGYLSVLPDIYMSYTAHSNGTHNGSPQVKLTNVATGANYTYTGSSDIKAVYIKDGVFNP